jgi:hypothetical protein
MPNRPVFLLLILSGIAFLGLRFTAGATPSSRSEDASRLDARQLAVIFEHTAHGRELLGIVSEESRLREISTTTPAKLARDAANDARTYRSHEIWVLRDGSASGYWYSSAQHLAGPLEDERMLPPSGAGAFAALVEAARPPAPVEAPSSPALGKGSYWAPPATLRGLVSPSEVIAVGRVVGIVRNGHTPVNSTGMLQHTVYAFAVEHYLKHSGDTPPVLKVWQTGGWLPWQEPLTSRSGVGMINLDDPMLNVGDRYCLFLNRPPADGEVRRRGYHTASAGGVTGRVADLDEYKAAHHWRGKLLLRGGLTRSPDVSRHRQHNHWQFESGPQILDIHEERALEAIADAVIQVEVDLERLKRGLLPER